MIVHIYILIEIQMVLKWMENQVQTKRELWSIETMEKRVGLTSSENLEMWIVVIDLIFKNKIIVEYNLSKLNEYFRSLWDNLSIWPQNILKQNWNIF